MAKLKNMVILLVVAAAAAILQSTEAANHTVGGSTGWTNSPPGGASFYPNWASNITFKENDTLVFNFVTGTHTVAELSKANFDSCNVNQNIEVFSTSPVIVTLNRTGEFYFACTISGHCSSGQKLSVGVTGSSPAPGQAPPPAQGPSPPPSSGTTPTPPSSGGAPPPASPTEPGATAPPPKGSATSLAATSSLLVIISVINLLF